MARMAGAARKLLIFAILLLAWHLAAKAEIWSAYVLPSPEKVGQALVSMAASGELAAHALISLKRVLVGFLVSILLTLILTLVGALMPRVVPYYSYLLGMMRHIPPLSLIPLLILWFGIGETPKIVVIVLASVFPILLNTETAVFGCPRELLDVGRTMGMRRAALFFKIQLPNAVPQIVLGMRLGLGYAWRAIVAAEMIAAASGLGYLVLDSQALSRTDKVVAGILVIGILGLAIDRSMLALERRVSHGRGEVDLNVRL